MRINVADVMGSRAVWGEDFSSRANIQSRGGVIVGCNVGAWQGGSISPTATSSRVTWIGTESVLANASAMTIALRFKTAAANNAAAQVLIAKSPSALNANQWHVQLEAGRILRLYVAASAADVASYISVNAALALATEYVAHLVFSAATGTMYLQGAVAASTVTGALPARMLATATPITVFNRASGATLAPDTDFLLRSARVIEAAWTAQECADDYARQTYQKVTGGLS